MRATAALWDIDGAPASERAACRGAGPDEPHHGMPDVRACLRLLDKAELA
jgi:hypothetical protein